MTARSRIRQIRRPSPDVNQGRFYMLMLRVALVDKTGNIDFPELTAVSAAINVQAQRDLSPIWGVSATVAALPSPHHIPVGVCPVFIVSNLPPGEGGVHLTKKSKQPY